MAEVYARVRSGPGRGMEIQRAIGFHEDVQGRMKHEATYRAAVARLILKSHRKTGDSFIEVLHGDMDYHIVLNDVRGQQAAMTIEFGRGPGTTNPSGPSEAVAPLRRAVKLL